MRLYHLVLGAVSLASLLGGCVTDNNYVRKDSRAWEQHYQGTNPKFMESPFRTFNVPVYDKIKFKR